MTKLPKNHKDNIIYTRYDFLLFDVKSIASPGNEWLWKQLDPAAVGKDASNQIRSVECESWENWKNFPNFEEHKSLTEGRALEILAWLVHTFAGLLYYCRIRGQGKKNRKEEEVKQDFTGIDSLTLDDFTFIFVQAQNNINKWNMFYKAWQKKYIKHWEETDSMEECEVGSLKKLPKDGQQGKNQMSAEDAQKINEMNNRGCEFPCGSGLGKGHGRTRYTCITKFLFHSYYNPDPAKREQVAANRKALDDAVKVLADKKRTRLGITDDDQPTSSRKKKSTKVQELDQDTELEEIGDYLYSCGVSTTFPVAV